MVMVMVMVIVIVIVIVIMKIRVSLIVLVILITRCIHTFVRKSFGAAVSNSESHNNCNSIGNGYA